MDEERLFKILQEIRVELFRANEMKKLEIEARTRSVSGMPTLSDIQIKKRLEGI